tara:strand:- start:95 stop:448 length:354 start_codon:yes stop_codon:yes gene_type:complete
MKAYSTLIKNPERKIKYKKFKEDGREQFHVGIWVDGSEEELDQVERVEYLLHPTFKNRLRTSRARSNGFSITFWAWGTFNVEVTIYKTNKKNESFEYPMTFDLPADDGTNYVDVSDV